MKKVFFVLALCLSIPFSVSARDRALLIGVDVYQQVEIPPTKGSTDDADALRQLLIAKFNFAPGSITVLKNQEATTQNILRELDRIVGETSPGDRVFFHYSGHGFQVPDEYIMDEKDGLDEVIAPYNVQAVKQQNGKVNLTLKNGTYITDDVFNDYAVKLVGRSVVMMFDSCHSGSLSRSLSSKSKENSRYLRLETKSRSIMSDADAFSYTPTSNSRDLSIVKDSNMGDGNLNGIVFISAASPYQEAFPIYMGNEKLRGALSFLFEQAHSKGTLPKISELKNSLLREMKNFEMSGKIQPGTNGQFQVPEIEVFSKNDIWNQPLFGAAIINDDFPNASNADYSSGLIAALTNQYSKIDIGFSLKWNGLPKENQSKTRFADKFYLNDEMEYTVDISEAGYLYILVFSANDFATCIFPAYTENNGKWEGIDTENYLEKGRHIFPRSPKQFPNVKGDYTPAAMPPYGKDVWVALFSKQKLPIGEKQNYTRNELLGRIGLDKLQKEVWTRTRGVGNKSSTVKLTDADWQSSIIEVETIR